eukprot:CAMPEP_0203661572 /NCGR_PEP_ID=MMETSP0088-20131115/59679_1 /ASSEMBLY_ACC=CAM_ASM_001087 /TAXON_ID=426623 /ORGANISM="Chaetoceros affinis, Strain CCMP159" /LENGTH=351 /DNA_ID=CAMNT_0050524251 /DNA_START=79 /DNA_END=1134 /DNA_ORIENTATION=-
METAPAEMKRVLVFGGKTGWIGGLMVDMVAKKGIEVKAAESRIEQRETVEKELDEFKPTHVLMSAGITGRPNIDWCEDNKPATIRTNVIGTLNVVDLCNMKNIHCTVYATGCIFKYDEAHPLGSGIGFTEDSFPNFAESFYSETKGYMEQMLKCYPSCLTLRVRMPISDDLIHRNFITKIAKYERVVNIPNSMTVLTEVRMPISDDLIHRNFITKIAKYERVVNIPNSMTVLTEMLPASLAMAQKGLTGVYNFTNPGVISHNECLDLYTKYIDPTYTYKNFTVEEQAKVIKAGRSNNELDTTKLMEDMPEGIEINDIKTAVEKCFQRMAVNLEKQYGGKLPDCLPAEFRRV